MPFWKRTVEPRRLLPPSAASGVGVGGTPCLAAALLPPQQLHDVCGLATLALLKQLADLCGHSAALLGELEGRLLELAHRAHRLRGRLHRVRGILRSGRAGPPRAPPAEEGGQPATSNLDLDVKKPHPPKLLWHQPVNIFLARPVGVEDLHHEAEQNLQTLLQEEYEEPYSEGRSGGQTFRYASPPSADRPLDYSPRAPSTKRLEFVFMPANQQAKESETTTLGVRTPEASLSLPASPDKRKAWTRTGPLPSVDEKRLHQPCSTRGNIVPINISGQPFARHASARHSLFNTETAMNPKSLLRRRRTVIGFPHLAQRDQGNSNGPVLNPPATIAESVSCNFVPEAASGRNAMHQGRSPQPRPQLRKTFSDLGGALRGRCCQVPAAGHTETPGGMYAGPSCNGPKENSVFSPAWSAGSFGYVSPSVSQSELTEECATHTCPSGSGTTPNPDRSASFFIGKDSVAGNNGSGSFSASPESLMDAVGGSTCRVREPKAPLTLPSPGEEECPQLERERIACKFRERSLSVPTDTASLCSVDIGGSETCGLSYPSASSEGSTDNISLAVEQDAQGQKRRQRTKSISLKKAKKKPSPPIRSVSLIKEEQGSSEEPNDKALPQEHRPKSLYLLPDPQAHSQVPGEATRELDRVPYTQQWYLPEWSSSDPYCSLSGSSTATATTVIELGKAHGSSESLPSPSISRATTPSHLSAEVNLKTSSPGRPTGVMSPSSGYSSQSETPTPTVPTSMVLGHAPHHQSMRARPLVPERKSSLPAVSPMERNPKSRLSFDLPFAPPTHLDLSGLKISLKGKAKMSRHHSESTFGTKLGPKLSPVQPVMPMVTQLDLRSVRLRSISRSETEDNLDSPEPTEEPGRKIRPPVAEKPPFSRRPPMLLHKTPPVQEESPDHSPTSPLTPQGSTPTENIYMVIKRRPEHEWDTVAWSPLESPSPSQDPPRAFFSATRQLSQGSLEEDEPLKPKLPAERTPGGESRKAKVPPPVPKKPSVVYLPLVSSPLHPGYSLGDPRLATSPLVMLDEDSAYPELTACKLSSLVAGEDNVSLPPVGMSWGDTSGSSADLEAEEKSFASGKTAQSITEEDDDVFMMSRTTEDLFTVIHRSKRKLLGWKEPSDAFANRQNPQVPSKNAMGPLSNEFSSAGSTRTSSRNEDFKALLQKKSGKSTSGIRTSAAELLKTTNPLARRVITEFAVDGTMQGPKAQP